jgi:hypothetical protein
MLHRGSLVWDAAASEILGLGQGEANRFVASLTGAELHRLGIQDPVHRYSLDERVPDAGCDLLLRVPADLPHHPYIPAGTSIWQVKSGTHPPDSAREIDSPKHVFVRKQLAAGAAYVLVCTQSFTPERQERLLAAFRMCVHAINPACDVRLLVATDLAKWAVNHPSIIRRLSQSLRLLYGWEEWNTLVRGDESLPFTTDKLRDDALGKIRAWVKGELELGAFIHLYGPSGVGKSRLLLEAFDTAELRDQVAFIDSPDRESVLRLDELIDQSDRLGTIVVDNCDFDQVERLHSLASRAAGKLRLITVGGLAGLDRTRPTPTYWRIQPLATANMMEVLRRALGLDGEQAFSVATLTEGYPRLAWLLGSRVRDGTIKSLADFSARADTASVLAALVPRMEDRRHLSIVGLFTRLGVEHELRVELEVVSRTFDVRAQDVLSTINRHPDLVQRYGRFAQVTPGLVCAWLVTQLVSDYGVDTVMLWISRLPAELQDRFAAQIAVLGEDAAYRPLAASFLAAVDLTQAPSAWSNSLRAAAILDHAGTVRWLVQKEREDPDEFRQLFGDAHLLSLFEHLLWFDDSFRDALGMLFRIAMSTYADAARPEPQAMLGGVFLTLLGGTAVPYERRVSELSTLISGDGTDAARVVGIRALLAGLSHFQSRNAPSLQGGVVRPAEWRPTERQEDHELRRVVWTKLMELMASLTDEHEREQFWVNVVDGLGQLSHVLDPSIWLTDLESREWPLDLRIRLRHGLGLVATLDGLPARTVARINQLCARLGPPIDPIELADFLLSAEPYQIARTYAGEDNEPRIACMKLAKSMAASPSVFAYALEAASRAKVSTAGNIFEEFAKLQETADPMFDAIAMAEPPVPLAVAGYLSGREACGDAEWVTHQLCRVPAAMSQALVAVSPSRHRAQMALDSANAGLVGWAGIAAALVRRDWLRTMSDLQVAELLGYLLLTNQPGYPRAAVVALDDRSESTPGLSDALLDLAERALIATADDVDAMLSFHRQRLMQREKITYDARLAVALAVARSSFREPTELAGLFRPLIQQKGVQALWDVFGAISRERESQSWSHLDHDIRGIYLLSLAASQLGAETVWNFIQDGGLGGTRVIQHVELATAEPSELVVMLVERGDASLVEAARLAFTHPEGAFFGPFANQMMVCRERAAHWAEVSHSGRVREWALSAVSAIDASLPIYQQRDAEFS